MGDHVMVTRDSGWRSKVNLSAKPAASLRAAKSCNLLEYVGGYEPIYYGTVPVAHLHSIHTTGLTEPEGQATFTVIDRRSGVRLDFAMPLLRWNLKLS
jgi:hypothetical protein